jgi:uncharacterized protein (DUF488 family)
MSILCFYKIFMNKKTIYTVGHSTHTIEYFVELIKAFDISCIVDVRSVAASRFNPQYNKDAFSNYLKKQGVRYLHFEKEFGARQENPSVLDEENKVDFEKVRLQSSFSEGILRLEKGLDAGYNIALMCSESEPFDCHRFAMVAIGLEKVGFKVQHILKDKTLISNSDLEKELLKKYAKKLPQPSIFEPDITPEMQLKAAYKLRNKNIAWSPSDMSEPNEN